MTGQTGHCNATVHQHDSQGHLTLEQGWPVGQSANFHAFIYLLRKPIPSLSKRYTKQVLGYGKINDSGSVSH